MIQDSAIVTMES